MANTFEFIGRIALGRDTNTFHPVEQRKFNSGWTNYTVRFNCLSGTNRVLCFAQGGKWSNDANNTIKTFSKTVRNADGSVKRGEAMEVAWAKRFDAEIVDQVAGNRRFVVNTADPAVMYPLQYAIEAQENGNADEKQQEILAAYESLDEAKAALTKMQAKRKVFIHEWDFVEHLVKVLQSDKFKNKLFRVSGNYDIQYNQTSGKFYTNYHVNRVVMVRDDVEQKTELRLDFYFGEDCYDATDFEETGKATMSGWTSYYDSNVKANGFIPVGVVYKPEKEGAVQYMATKFVAEDDEIKQVSLSIDVLDGSERKEIRFEDLDEKTKMDIEYGVVDFETYKRQMGGNVYGDRVREWRFKEIVPDRNGNTDAKETVYHVEDMAPARAKEDEYNYDIFDEDDDL